MKHFIITLVFLFWTILSIAQNLSLDQVINLRTKTLAEVEEYLTLKKWELIRANGPTETSKGYASFAYGKNIYDDKAVSFISYYYNDDFPEYNRINIQINVPSTYTTFLTRLKALGYKLTSSRAEDGDIVKIYKGKVLTVEVTTSTQTDFTGTKTTYHFFICSTFDYNLQFGN